MDVRAALQDGLHTDNLEHIASLARLAIFDPSANVPGFVIEQIANGLCTFWDGPPDSDRHKAAERKLKQPLIDVADAVIRAAPDEEMRVALSRAISAYHVVVSGA